MTLSRKENPMVNTKRFLLSGILTILLAIILVAAGPLAEIKTVQVDATEVPDPSKVKNDWAANWVHDQLVGSLQQTGFQVGDSPVHAKIILQQFSSGNTAGRVTIGLGTGRSSITGTLVFTDVPNAKQLSSAVIHVRGSLKFSPDEGGNTQRKQAENSFEQILVEEIEGLK
jgi:hypothetical protein